MGTFFYLQITYLKSSAMADELIIAISPRFLHLMAILH
ncbi:hypothetical protein EPIR_0598 [Erwinia piriflorinigrans CFBP 5888]|uniref:Uncharacterized protein n=1 Tax=Erwinia piriflorinigrans CFBP 5888 TaxID=1161919 RepID=V5Z4U6_9GAMM|nr:hypothetical protein EPIR_0598 [Erwinia piriflorinigrans CFBP 5888]